MNHFDEMTGLLYLEDQLDAGRSREVSAHLSACAECRNLLQTLQREDVWLREALAEEEEEFMAARLPGSRNGVSWGWIAALGFAGAGAYTLWSGFIEPWSEQAAQAGFTQGSLLTMFFFSGAFWKGWDTMQSWMEFTAVTTVGFVAMWLLHRHWRRVASVTAVMSVMACVLALSPSVFAADVQHGNPNFTLAAGQEVKTDLIVAARVTQIDGDVDGDLIVFSKNVTVNGHVKGDILAFSREIRVNGLVDGNVRVFAETFTLAGIVAKNAMCFNEQFDLDEKSKVSGTLTVWGSDVELNGQTAGDALLFGGTIEINGLLGHDARIRTERLSIGPGAGIKGQVQYTGPREPDVSPSAKLGSPVTVTIQKQNHRDRRNYGLPYRRQLFFLGAAFVFGLAFLLFLPGLFADASQACKKFGPAFGFGLLFLCATPIAALIVCATIVGLGVGIAALMLYAVALFSSQVFVGTWLGEKLLGAGSTPGVSASLGRLALGLAIIHGIEIVPYAGSLAHLLVAVWGLGALVLAIYKNLHPQWSAAA